MTQGFYTILVAVGIFSKLAVTYKKQAHNCLPIAMILLFSVQFFFSGLRCNYLDT